MTMDQMHIEPVDDEDDLDLLDTAGNAEDKAAEMQPGDEKDITGDGGVIKTLLVQGGGWEQPQKDDKVSVHYTGTLEDGTKFDSSVDRGEPFEFTLGASQVIKGWDKVVATMKKGEKVSVKLRSDYGYGDRGSPPKIPGGATLIFEIELLSWESRNDLSEEKDGSLMKTILREGDLAVWNRPKDRDLVTAKVTARVAGSSEPFIKDLENEFTLDDGWLCPAVKIGVASMKQGELIRLKAAARHAFGADGYEGCPPDSNVEIDIDLVHCKSVVEVDPDNHGAVVKTVLKEGVDYNSPNDDASCLVSWTAQLEDGTEFDKAEEVQVKTCANAFPCDAVELTVCTMKAGEIVDVVVRDPAYAFGAAGKPDASQPIPPNAVVKYHIELHSFENGKSAFELEPAEKLERAEKLKELGNTAFKAGALARAARYYSKVEQTLTSDHDFSADDKARSRDLQASTSLNRAAVALKCKQYQDCIAHCNNVLEKKPGLVKALYRRSQAYIETGDFVESEVDLRAAIASEPDNKDLQAAMKRLKQRSKAQNQKDKKLFGAMFSKMGKMYKDVPNPAPPSKEPLLEGEAPGPAPPEEEMQENVDAN